MANRYLVRPLEALSEDEVHQVLILMEHNTPIADIKRIFNISRSTYYKIFNTRKSILKTPSK